jgi:hypothetical protein
MFVINVHHHHHFPTGASALSQLRKELQKMSEQLEALAAAVAANTTVTGSAIELLNGLHAKILELLAQEVIDPAAVQALADDLSAQTQALADAITANTPAVPA